MRNIIIAIATLATVAAHGQMLNLGNEPVTVYLGAQEVAAVYIGSTLVYPSVSFPDKNGYIYNEGEHEDMWDVGYSSGPGSQSKEIDHLYLAAGEDGDPETPWFPGENGIRTYVLDNTIDLTSWDTVKADIVRVKASAPFYLNAGTEKMVYFDQMQGAATASGVVSIDVSELSGHYYIRLHCRAYEGESIYKVTKVWLE